MILTTEPTHFSRATELTNYTYKVLHLPPTSPLASSDRLPHPILSYIRSDLLLTRPQALDILTEVLNMDPSHPEAAAPHLHESLHLVDWISRLPPSNGERNTTVVLSTGSKWTEAYLLGFTQGELTHAFAHGVRTPSSLPFPSYPLSFPYLVRTRDQNTEDPPADPVPLSPLHTHPTAMPYIHNSAERDNALAGGGDE